jgi:hypothetical protein
MFDYKRLSELWIKVAEENDMLGEVCILKDYDPEIGKVPEHFVPGLPWFFMLHFLKAVAAEGIDFPSVAAGVQGDAARDEFNGDNAALCRSIEALLALDAAKALVPHGVGGHARSLLSAAMARLSGVAK